MPITFACRCGKKLRVNDENVGRVYTCPACNSAIEVPNPRGVDLGIDMGYPSDAGVGLADSSPKSTAIPGPDPHRVRVEDLVAVADRVYAHPPSLPCDYEYRMHQMASRIEIKEGVSHRQMAANYLQEIVNAMAEKGWEFCRVDTLGITENPGCLGAFFGARSTTTSYFVATFRRLRERP